jgi:FtsZ-interacting cell division protein ZipA
MEQIFLWITIASLITLAGIILWNRSRTRQTLSFLEGFNTKKQQGSQAHQSAFDFEDPVQDDLGLPQGPTERPYIVQLRLMAAEPQRVNGHDILNAARGAGMEMNPEGVLEYRDETGHVLMVLVNAFEPGFFPVQNMSAFSTSEMIMVFTLPASERARGHYAFGVMLAVADQISQKLALTLVSSSGEPLGNMDLYRMERDILNYVANGAQ